MERFGEAILGLGSLYFERVLWVLCFTNGPLSQHDNINLVQSLTKLSTSGISIEAECNHHNAWIILTSFD